MKKLNRIISLLTAFTVLFCLCSCGKNNKPDSSPPVNEEETGIDEIAYSLPVLKNDSVNPFDAVSDTNRSFSTLLYDSLFTVDNTYKSAKLIASDYSVAGNTLTVKIKDNLTFSDGTKLTSEDVVYSFNLAQNSDNYAYDLRNISSVTANGDFSVNFIMNHSDSELVSALIFPVIKKGSEIYDESDKENFHFPIGSGRYFYRADENTKYLSVNKNRLGGYHPLYNKIGIKAVNDEKSLQNLMYVGSLDYYMTTFVDGMYKSYSGEYKKTDMNNFVYLGINSENSFLSKSEVRRAISLIMDRSEMVSVSYAGFGTETSTPFPVTYYKLSGITLPTTDCNKVAGIEILSKITSQESPTVFKLIVNEENAFKVALAHSIAQVLEEAGFSITIESFSYSAYLERVEQGSYDLYIGECKIPHSMDLSQFFFADGTLSHGISKNSPSSAAYINYSDGKISLQNFIDCFADDLPFIPIAYREGYMVKGSKLNVTPEISITDYYLNINEWDVIHE